MLLGHRYHAKLHTLLLQTAPQLKRERPHAQWPSPPPWWAAERDRLAARNLACPPTCSAQQDVHLHTDSVLTVSCSNSVYHMNYTELGFSYNPEEFCVSLVKGCLEVKSISILCFSGTSKEVMVPSRHSSILWEAGWSACATDLHLPLKGSSHNCVVQFC